MIFKNVMVANIEEYNLVDIVYIGIIDD